ncbi:MAG: AAA family ATPase [Anaerolineae bacterium]
MKIESFTIRNYRSIRRFQIDNLSPINVFFGKNNVGKSNILRGLHLAFYSLKDDRIFLPDTMFYNRNIYRPIEITIDLILEEDFCDAKEVMNALDEGMQSIRSTVADDEELFKDIIREVDDFIRYSESFKPLKKLRLGTSMNYDEETSNIRVWIRDLGDVYMFDYGEYRISYQKLQRAIEQIINREKQRSIESLTSGLARLGVDLDDLFTVPFRFLERLDRDELTSLRSRIARYAKDPDKVREAQWMIDQYIDQYIGTLQELTGKRIEPFSKTFDIVKQYFDKLSDSFVLIPNKEYFSKGPFNKKGGQQIEIFATDRFEDRLLSLIESPSKKDREFIEKFNSVFSTSYKDLGGIEISKFRDRVFAIFDTGFTALPIENQGLGIQDLFLYLAHTILFDSAIIAIEEPEGGLSAENQRILHNIIEDVYSGSDKQIFISSHSEEFETPNSYIIEMGVEGTKEISRIEKQKEYEEKIDGILIRRRLAEETEHYEALLKEIAERQITLDILSYIGKIRDEEGIDAQRISNDLGYEKEKVEAILEEIAGRRT